MNYTPPIFINILACIDTSSLYSNCIFCQEPFNNCSLSINPLYASHSEGSIASLEQAAQLQCAQQQESTRYQQACFSQFFFENISYTKSRDRATRSYNSRQETSELIILKVRKDSKKIPTSSVIREIIIKRFYFYKGEDFLY